MKLADWIKAHRGATTIGDFAKALDTSESTVYRWLSGTHRPQMRHMLLIAEVTGGAVQPHDFFDVVHQPASSARLVGASA